jgi:hypothetical protein
MLPLHASSPRGKMHRHAYLNGHAAYPLGGSGTFSIQPHKYALTIPCIREDQGSRLAFMLTYILTADFNLDRSLH